MTDIKYNKGIAIISALVDKYKNSGRLTEEMAHNIINSIEGKDLNIAVIGKMKAGKSSFTNALIFHDKVLPSGPEPTTVTLTEIVYTDNPDKDSIAEVELLTKSDIEDLEVNLVSGDSKVAKKAKELLDMINCIPGGYDKYISKGTVEIDLDDLKKFTSTGSELSGLAKKVTIYKHSDEIRGLRITDTPGFNDPVISRGESTKNALRDSHIILFVHDYLDKYDEDELAILLEQVEYSGVSMLVDVINKIDTNEDLQINEWPLYIDKFNVKKLEAIKQIPKDGIKELLKKSKTSYVSALMALIGYEVLKYQENRKSGKEIQINEETKEFFVEYQSGFPELDNAEDFIKYSNIYDIVDIINQLSQDKNKYLVNYPIQTLIGTLKSLVEIIDQEIKGKQTDLSILKDDAAQAQHQIDVINETLAALGNQINSPLLATTLRECVRKTKHYIRDSRDSLSTTEFTETNYEDGTIFNSGPKNRNLSRYKGVLADFDSKIRNSLENLKDEFENQCEAYVNNLVEGLIINNITKKDRDLFSEVIVNLLKSEISKGLPIMIDPDEPSYCLSGDGMQFSVYRSDFINRRNDSVIEESYLKIFRTFIENTICSEILRDAITEQIEELKAKLKSAVSFSPAEKENELAKLEAEIAALRTEIQNMNADIESLEEIKE